MSLRVVLTLAAVCAATPLGAAEASDAQAADQTAAQRSGLQAGLREPDAASRTAPRTAPGAGDAAPRRYSLHREYGETPDPAAFTRPQAAAEQDLVLAPGFFEPLPPTLAAPPAAPARDRQGRPIQQSDPDDSPRGLNPAMSNSRLTDLIALAKETSSEKRRVLLREITDLFFTRHAPTDPELRQFDGVLTQLASDMEEAVRAELSDRFAGAEYAPRRLIFTLANDEAIAVAEPVLSRSNSLSEDDLLQVVKTHGQDHLRAVSRREVVPEAVSDVIVERGDDQTLNVLLRNDGARLSREASEAAVERATRNPELHEAVIERKNLPADLLNEMYFVAEARLRQRILEENAKLDPAVLEQALAAGRKRVALQDGALPPDYDQAESYVAELRAAGELTPKMLARFLRSGGMTLFLVALAQLAEIDFHTARTIVEKKELDALAVVCKAAELDRTLFLTYAVVLLNSDTDAMGRAQEYGKLYGELPRDTALRTLRFWRLRRQTAEMAA